MDHVVERTSVTCFTQASQFWEYRVYAPCSQWLFLESNKSSEAPKRRKKRSWLRDPITEGCAAEVRYWPGLYASEAENREPIRENLPTSTWTENDVDRDDSRGSDSGVVRFSVCFVVSCCISYYHVSLPRAPAVSPCQCVYLCDWATASHTLGTIKNTHRHTPVQRTHIDTPWRYDGWMSPQRAPEIAKQNPTESKTQLKHRTHIHTSNQWVTHTLAWLYFASEEQKIQVGEAKHRLHRCANKANCAE